MTRGRRDCTPSPGYRRGSWLSSVARADNPTVPYASMRGGGGGVGSRSPMCASIERRMACRCVAAISSPAIPCCHIARVRLGC